VTTYSQSDADVVTVEVMSIPADPPAAKLPEQVLIVDDDQAFRSLLEIAISGFGYEVEVVGTADEAWELITQFPPDLIILDLNLGVGPTGLDVAEKLRRSELNIPVIILSVHRSPRLVDAQAIPVDKQYTYLVKSDLGDLSVLQNAIVRTLANKPVFLPLDPDTPTITRGQAEVLRLIAEGYSNISIADMRGCSVRSLERIVNRLYQALEIDPTPGLLNPRVVAARMYLESKVTVR